MILGLLKEHGTETRVALLPETVKTFTDLKVEVIVEKGAGEKAFATDADYEAVGAKIVSHGKKYLNRQKFCCKFSRPLREIQRKLKIRRFGSVHLIRCGIPNWWKLS